MESKLFLTVLSLHNSKKSILGRSVKVKGKSQKRKMRSDTSSVFNFIGKVTNSQNEIHIFLLNYFLSVFYYNYLSIVCFNFWVAPFSGYILFTHTCNLFGIEKRTNKLKIFTRDKIFKRCFYFILFVVRCYSNVDVWGKEFFEAWNETNDLK